MIRNFPHQGFLCLRRPGLMGVGFRLMLTITPVSRHELDMRNALACLYPEGAYSREWFRGYWSARRRIPKIL